jgi:hypothetical protein
MVTVSNCTATTLYTYAHTNHTIETLDSRAATPSPVKATAELAGRTTLATATSSAAPTIRRLRLILAISSYFTRVTLSRVPRTTIFHGGLVSCLLQTRARQSPGVPRRPLGRRLLIPPSRPGRRAIPRPRLLLVQRPPQRLATAAARAQHNGRNVEEKGGMAQLAANQARLASSTASITRSVSERCGVEYDEPWDALCSNDKFVEQEIPHAFLQVTSIAPGCPRFCRTRP